MRIPRAVRPNASLAVSTYSLGRPGTTGRRRSDRAEAAAESLAEEREDRDEAREEEEDEDEDEEDII